MLNFLSTERFSIGFRSRESQLSCVVSAYRCLLISEALYEKGTQGICFLLSAIKVFGESQSDCERDDVMSTGSFRFNLAETGDIALWPHL